MSVETSKPADLLDALRKADTALYQLWLNLEIGGEFIGALNELQDKFIHPELNRIERLEQ